MLKLGHIGRIAIPVALQSFLQLGLTNVDTLMVGRLGEWAIGAVSISNEVLLFINLIVSAFTITAGVYAAQLFGRNDKAGLAQVEGWVVTVCCGFSLVSVFFLLGFQSPIIDALTSSDTVRVGLSQFWGPAILSLLPGSLSLAFASLLRSRSNTRTPLYFALLAMGVNTVLNVFWISRYGLAGAAYASLIAKTIECVAFLAELGRLPLVGFGKLGQALLRGSIPLLWHHGLTGSGLLFLVWIYGQLGTEALAASRLVNTVAGMTVTLLLGLQVAGNVLVGQKLGAGDAAQAQALAKEILWLSAKFSLVIVVISTLASLAFSREIALTAVTYRYFIVAILIHALFVPFKVLNMVLLGGVLLSGGKGREVLRINVIAFWCVAVPLTWVTGSLFQLPFWVVFTASLSNEWVKFVMGWRTYREGSWAQCLV